MGCSTQILLLLDNISASATSDDDPNAEAAQTLRTQMIYAGLPLDLALECLKSCTATNADGRGSAFLDAAGTFAYSSSCWPAHTLPFRRSAEHRPGGVRRVAPSDGTQTAAPPNTTKRQHLNTRRAVERVRAITDLVYRAAPSIVLGLAHSPPAPNTPFTNATRT
uniref:Uncharacterized protein n=1 Tax=Mycena chlorophos TaxID=658473 RepID=A0ABQ0KYQ6_MYCCL|nr:predicted protein [Mycena chlorophos]